MKVQEMIAAHANGLDIDTSALQECIEACFECAQACTACADACIEEGSRGEMDLRHCIRTDLDCADICATTGQILSRQTQPSFALLRAQVEACKTACQECGEECRSHADQHEHCKVCGEACKRCEEACDQLLSVLQNAKAAV